ncbi:hypothetical protein BH11PSE2_BH11PSE2_03110 [soil metagenome]
MRIRSALAIGAAVVLAGPLAMPSLAGAADAPAPKNAYKAPLTSWGKPDLEGNWTNSSLTRLERDNQYGARLELNDNEVKAMEGERQASIVRQDQKTDPNATVDQVNSTCEVKGYTGGPACGYNGAWTDPGDVVMRVAGKPRTSFITSTPDGKVPAVIASVAARAAASRLPAGVKQNDNPEGRSLGERCLMSFGFSSGPVMQPQLYNSNYQFVQTKDELAIWVEMVHDVRHIRIGGTHRTDGVRSWMGDSIAHWDGDTLVAETTNYSAQQAFRGADQNLKVTEKFTRVASGRILYQFTVEDPTVWAQPWGGEYEFGTAKGGLYEYACHEGNYGLEGILAGARAEDEDALKKTASR